jgi:hypothetical protein
MTRLRANGGLVGNKDHRLGKVYLSDPKCQTIQAHQKISHPGWTRKVVINGDPSNTKLLLV